MNSPLLTILKEYKRQRGLSYRRLGELFDMSHTHMADVLEQRSPLTWEFCAKAADVLEISKVQAFILGLKMTRAEAEFWANSNSQEVN